MGKSTLEKILKQLQADVYVTMLEFTKGKREVANDNDWIPQRQKAEQAIKQHYLGLIGKPGEVIPYTRKQDNFATGYAHAIKDFRSAIESEE